VTEKKVETVEKAEPKKIVQYCGTGRRKTSVARVRLVPGKGRVTINKRSLEGYFSSKPHEVLVKEPLELTGTLEKFDVLVRVNGGGNSGQAGAIRHGIARALVKADDALRPSLHKAGFLTRDSRMVERKKPGRPGARKRFQFSKR
jgi:small subunit ribosomal protein S9